MESPVTIMALATHRLGRDARTGQDFVDAELPIYGGCRACGASIAAYNAHPAKDGYLRCADCIGYAGYPTVEAANTAIFEEGECAA